MSDTPTEYFGPHAKRWTNPDTGVTLSLSPRDYYQMAAEREHEAIQAAAAANSESLEKEAPARYDRTTAETMHARQITADTMNPGVVVLSGGTMRYASLVKDDTFGSIHPVEQTAPGKPAARHFRRRRITRNMVRLGLVYIIAVIGVISVAVEVL